ncbi:hypothetical protein NEDG_01283 [Nematocida displodere]|uniref:Uncharacterized protein n=1 Tax=Nematocida displodere TaxID=1805483 RepID=A0A177ECU3_9MICR|nr:hypothetical protein NEDG_01283 [Nematocida displodere]
MNKLQESTHPFIYLLLVLTIILILAYMVWTHVLGHLRFKTEGDRQVTMVTVYLTAICGFIAWGCVFLSQATPILPLEQ